MPTGDYFGGHRPGNNCLARACGGRSADRQTHLAFPAGAPPDLGLRHSRAPILVDITVGGKKIKAVAQPTKQASCMIDRQTGQPVWPIEERPVVGAVPMNTTDAAVSDRRRPSSARAFLDDVIDFTPALKAEPSRSSRNKIGPPSRRRSPRA
jgi:quinoprotein glucose dehydrogenase